MSTIQISALPAASAITADDLLPIEHDPSGTPVTQKATAAQVATTVLAVAGAYVTTNIVPSASSLPINASQADVDVRIKGDTDAALVFLDAGTNRVGIGTATPTTLLDVSGTLKATAFTGSGASLTGITSTTSNFQSLASDPASPTNGDVWYNSTSNTFKGRRAGLTQTFTTSNYLIATGGTITTSGNYKIHTFLSSGTFTVTHLGTAPTVDYLVAAGGGGGGELPYNWAGAPGGGGGGGYRTASGITVTASAYTVTVGAGGAIYTTGSDSTFASTTSAGGGRGSLNASSDTKNGGSGGGGTGSINAGGGMTPPGSGNTPSTSPSQGNNGAYGSYSFYSYGLGGGGGGAGGGGSSYNGGEGSLSAIDGFYYCGGGSGGYEVTGSAVLGGVGARGAGYARGYSSGGQGGDGSSTSGGRNVPTYENAGANTGGGGACKNSTPNVPSYTHNAGTGGSGAVVIRYQYQ